VGDGLGLGVGLGAVVPEHADSPTTVRPASHMREERCDGISTIVGCVSAAIGA
jgi:hypothetical protein